MEEKTLHNSNVSGAKENVKDLKIVGDGDMFTLLCKASSQNEGWMKSTKAMEIPGVGCVVQVTTQQKNIDGTYSVAEAVTFVPGVKIKNDDNNGHKLVHVSHHSFTKFGADFAKEDENVIGPYKATSIKMEQEDPSSDAKGQFDLNLPNR